MGSGSGLRLGFPASPAIWPSGQDNRGFVEAVL